MKSQSRLRSFLTVVGACSVAASGWAQAAPAPLSLQLQRPLPSQLNPPPPNFGLTATVSGPLSITLNWLGVPGAQGYTVLRDGVVITDQISSVRSFVDAAIKPLSQHSYQLRADGLTVSSIAHVPLTSPSVTIFLPSPPSPTGLTAVVAGTQVRLTWTAQTAAVSYEVRKGLQVLPAAGGASPMFVDPAAGSGDFQYQVRSIVRAYDGSDNSGQWSAPLTVRTRPFNFVILGDSIMWGQGLNTPGKFSSIVGMSLMGMIGGHPVNSIDKAHSGARIGTYSDDSDRPANATMVGGEVPEDYPTVLNQAMTLVPRQVDPATVDLILMDGCANDVGVLTVIAPTTTDDSIISSANQYCGLQMEQNLEKIHGLYKNAKIIVTGYFPIVSPQSDLTSIIALLVALNPAIGIAGGIDVRSKAIDHSTVFFAKSTSSLTSAIATANSRIGANVIKYVAPTFDASNSYAAPNTFLWLVPAPPTFPTQFDQVFWQRQVTCRQMLVMPVSCPPASGGHPNALGALAYANAIIPALSEFLPLWRSQFALVQRATP